MRAQHLFERFLEDPQVYDAARLEWVRVWEAVDPALRAVAGWQHPWCTRTYADGTPIRDGNPIFSAMSATQRKAVRIVQFPPATDEPELTYWLDTFGGDALDPDAITELVISCAFSREVLPEVSRLISEWIGAGASSDISLPAPPTISVVELSSQLPGIDKLAA